MRNLLNTLAVLLFVGNMAIANTPATGDVAKLKAEVIEHKDGVVAVHYAADEEGTVVIRIKNARNGEIVYTDREYENRLVVKRYDLSYLPTGKYIIEVSLGEETITKEVTLQ